MAIDLNDGSNILTPKGSTTPSNNVDQLLPGNLVLSDEFGYDLDGQLGIGERSPTFQFLGSDGGEGVRYEQAIVLILYT